MPTCAGFVYDKSALDVRSLPDASALDACDFSESTLLGSTGNTVVPLNDATTYYFSSNKDGFSVECSTFGVRFQAVVTNATTARSPPPPAFVKLPSPPQAGSSGGFDIPQENTGTGQPSTPSSGSGVNVPAGTSRLPTLLMTSNFHGATGGLKKKTKPSLPVVTYGIACL